MAKAGTFTEGADSRRNIKGRPRKGQCLTDILSWALDQKKTVTMGGKEQELLVRQLLTEKLINLAIGGDTTAIKYIFDRIDGKPKETIEHNGGLQLLKITDTDEEAIE